jgi:hypothetical protein
MPPPSPTLGHGWLIAEDEAMKSYLQGLTVSDSTSGQGRPVPVWFRLPEQEERQRTYPYIAIDMLDITEANQRQMVGRLNLNKLPYSPPVPVPALEDADHTLTADWPVAVDIHYQITVVSRSARHDRQLQALLWQKFPGKWGALYVHNDETARTMQLVGRSAAHDVDEFGKRTFRTNYTVTVASEMWASIIRQIHNLMDITIGVVLGVGDLSIIGIELDCHE